MHSLLKTLFGVVLTLTFGPAFACTEGSKGCDAGKREWVEYIQDNLPFLFCDADSPFVKCADVSPVQCRKIASAAATECLAKLDQTIPPLLNRTEAGNRGEAVGDCMGGKMFKAIKLREDKDPGCAGML